jgi:hypothetical protein
MNELADSGVQQPDAAPPPSHDDKALELIGNAPGPVEDYIHERRANEEKEQAEDRGERHVITRTDRAEQAERIRRALHAAKGENLTKLGVPAEVAPHITSQDIDAAVDSYRSGHEAPETAESFEQRIRQDEATKARFAERAETFFRNNPAAAAQRADVGAVFEYMPLNAHAEKAVLESPLGPRIAFELAQDPNLIFALNDLPPAEIARRIALAEGYLHATDQFAAQQPAPDNRRITRAPAPIRPLTGGASAGADPNKMSMSQYAKWRKAQDND